MSFKNCDKTMKNSIKWIVIVIILCEYKMEVEAEFDSEKIPLVRLPSNTLLKYTAYKDVSILHFVVPSDTRTAYFNFKAYEETKSAFQRQCKPRDVTLHLKAGSYPVISPENITFPKHFLHANQRFEIYNLKFKSDGSMQRMSIDGPNTGDWYAIAFISWTDPSNDRIEQQGLAASCETLLLSEMYVVSVKPIILNADNGLMYNNTLYAITNDRNANNNNKSNQRNSNSSSSASTTTSNTTTNANTDKSKGTATAATSLNHARPSIIYKFFVPRYVDVVELHFNIIRACNQCQAVLIHVQANALPTPKHFVHSIVMYANKTSENKIEFYPNQNAWHYIEIDFVNGNNDNDNGAINTTTTATSLSNNGSSSRSSSSSNSNSIKAFKSKARQDKRQFLMENNIFVNFSIGLQYIYESLAVVESASETRPTENKSTANGNSNKDDSKSSNYTDESIRSENVNRKDNTLNSNSSSLPDQNLNRSTTTPATSDANSFNVDVDDFNNNNNNNNNGDDDYDVDGDFGSAATATAIADDMNIDFKPNVKIPAKPRNINYHTLLRQTYREFFMFDYDLLPDDNGTIPTFINLTAGIPTGFRFDVGNVFDIGGTLSFAVVMKDNLHDATIAAAASAANIVKSRNSRIRSDVAVAEKLVHINDEMNDAPSHELTEDKANLKQPIDSMNFELNHSNENDDDDDTVDDAVDDAVDNNSSGSNQTIIICMHLNAAAIPKWPNQCVYGQHIFPAASIMNNTNEETSTGLIHVPFPEPGTWYVTLGLFCHGAQTTRITIIDSVKDFIKKYIDLLHDVRYPCACANRIEYYQKCIGEAKCLSELNESETLKVKECLMDSKCTSKYKEMARKFEQHHRYATEQSVATDSNTCNASAVFTISSSPCVAGRCGRYGRCYHYMSGGFVFSTCLCIKGYRGWDCTEDSQVPSSFSILLALLLLTLSNLLFIPSIYIAVRRKYFTEGIIYFFAMFFSIFYHACDSGEDEYSFCLVKIGVLQFCDFFCGLLAIWVTLIAMAHIRQTFVSILHMAGAVVIAFGTELNKQSLWVFLAPALTGLCLISINWGWRCKRTQKWFPSRRYLSIFLPIGMILVMCGLICYAFLQTRHNYFVVHSAWHMLMALSILCLLPNRNTFMPKC